MEVMISAALLGFIAIALLPSLFALVDNSKVQAFRSVCSTLVRSKLQEYVNGVSTTVDANDYAPTGFEYSKLRFQTYHSDCQATTAGASPGFRELVNSNSRVSDTAPNEDRLPANMMGYQQYVLLRHYNPRKTDAASTGSNQPKRGCADGDANYQFYRVGDGIEVTVTGMIRTTPAYSSGGRGGAKFGKLEDQGGLPHPLLTCSVSQIIYPPRLPFRYYLGSDGKIRNYQATIAFAANLPTASLSAMEAHFRSLWSLDVTGGTASVNSRVLSNIRSFAIAPDNQSAYILKPGRLDYFGDCNDQNITIDGTAFQQVPDCARDSLLNKTWSVDSNIENIAVDFGAILTNDADGSEDTPFDTDDRVFGLFNSGSTDGDIRQLTRNADGSSVWTANTTDADGGAAFTLQGERPRIRAIFISQNFPAVTKPSLFYIDNSCYTGTTASTLPSWVHCATIFNSGDRNMIQDVRELPLRVEGVSQ